MKNDKTVPGSTNPADNLYPHIKITNEEFPRILATRKIENDGAEYFGAFLSKTAVRILLDFLNRIFRLRTCDIPVDGSFPVPCTQYYRRRCNGPCVSTLCSRKAYLEMTGLARLFLSNQRGNLSAEVSRRISRYADRLDFESAAKWRDMLSDIDKFWANPRLQVWLDDTVDTYGTDETATELVIYLVTQRARHVLGRKVFAFSRDKVRSAGDGLHRVIADFYRCHLPKEIRVPVNFENRAKLAANLSDRFGRELRIQIVGGPKRRVTADRALDRAAMENEIDAITPQPTPEQIARGLKNAFDLPFPPKRIVAFDVADISGKSFVSAAAVMENGRLLSAAYDFQISNEASETNALAQAVKQSADKAEKPIDLVLLDGGMAQMNAVKSLELGLPLLAAVKPSGKHGRISHFLANRHSRVDFDIHNGAHGVLQLLRDEAHELANRVHRDLRDMGHFYEIAAVLPSLNEAERRAVITTAGTLRKLLAMNGRQIVATFEGDLSVRIAGDLKRHRLTSAPNVVPLIVPIRYVAAEGNADDLIPIKFR